MSTNSFKNDSQGVSEFLSQPKGNPMSRLQDLKAALERPDGLPEEEPIAASITQLRPQEQPAKETQAPSASPVVGQQTAEADELKKSSDAGLEIPQREPSKGGRPLLGNKPKVEKTFAIDEDIHQRLIDISNWEGIRHRKKFSVSHMMNHALMFAIAHMEGTNMIPIDGKDGLVIPVTPAKETTQ